MVIKEADIALDILAESPDAADALVLRVDELDHVVPGQVGGVIHDDMQDAVFDLVGYPPLLEQPVRPDPFEDFLVQGRSGRLITNELCTEEEGEVLGHFLFRYAKFTHQHVVESDLGDIGMGGRFLKNFVVDQVLVQQVVVAGLLADDLGGDRQPVDVMDRDRERCGQLE